MHSDPTDQQHMAGVRCEQVARQAALSSGAPAGASASAAARATPWAEGPRTPLPPQTSCMHAGDWNFALSYTTKISREAATSTSDGFPTQGWHIVRWLVTVSGARGTRHKWHQRHQR